MATIVTRSGKGSPLTHAEVDANFTNLNTDKLELSGGTMTGNLSFGDNDKAIFGAGSDLQIYHDGSGSFVDDQGTGGLILRGTNLFLRSSTNENYLGAVADGAVTIYHDNAQKLVTTSTGISVTGNATFADNGKAIFGAGSDLQIYHETSTGNSRIVESGSGHLNIEASNLNLKTPSGENYINCNDNGNVLLRYDNAQKLATTATGVDITGTLTSDGLTVDGNAKLSAGSPTLRFTETDQTDLHTRMTAGGGSIYIQTENDAESVRKDRFRINHSTGDISFYEDTGTTAKFFWDASAESLGIGTSSPSAPLEVSASGASIVQITSGTNTSQSALYFADPDDTNAGYVLYDHTSNYMSFRTNGSGEDMRIDSSGNVGIGTSSPATKVHLKGDWVSNEGQLVVDANSGQQYSGLTIQNNNSSKFFLFHDNTNNLAYVYGATGQGLAFSTDNAEAMRIDSSGFVTVGTTNISPATNNEIGISLHPTGRLEVNKDSPCAYFGRKSTDGDIAQFRKDGTTVGSIGTNGNLYIQGPTGTSGAEFANNAVRPWKDGARVDATVDLGVSAGRFKDLYLSGGVVFGSTGGSVTSKTLDDYEEGTWTIGFTGATITPTNSTGYYTKIGNRVFVQYYSGSSTISGASGAALFTGLPFTVSSATYSYLPFYTTHNTYFGNSTTAGVSGFFNINTTGGNFVTTGVTSSSTYVNGSGKYIMLAGFYYTNS